MPFDHGREQLSSLDREVLAFIERGEVGAACAMAGRTVPGEATEADQGGGLLADRLAAGERMLAGLGLVPAPSDAAEAGMVRTGLILLPSPAARRVTLVFNGNTINFSLPHRLASDTSTHIVMMRDPNRCFGFLGIPELGADYDACLHNLRRLIAALAVEDVYCVGMSAGGSTALKFGCDLQVRGILGFSVPTTLDLADDPGAEMRHYPQLTRLYKGGRHLGIDLAKYYAASLPRPGVMLVYSESHVRDAWLAERMRGIPGVELVATDGFSGHKTFRWLQNTGSLGLLLERLFAMDQIRTLPADPGTAPQQPG